MGPSAYNPRPHPPRPLAGGGGGARTPAPRHPHASGSRSQRDQHPLQQWAFCLTSPCVSWAALPMETSAKCRNAAADAASFLDVRVCCLWPCVVWQKSGFHSSNPFPVTVVGRVSKERVLVCKEVCLFVSFPGWVPFSPTVLAQTTDPSPNPASLNAFAGHWRDIGRDDPRWESLL